MWSYVAPVGSTPSSSVVRLYLVHLAAEQQLHATAYTTVEARRWTSRRRQWFVWLPRGNHPGSWRLVAVSSFNAHWTGRRIILATPSALPSADTSEHSQLQPSFGESFLSSSPCHRLSGSFVPLPRPFAFLFPLLVHTPRCITVRLSLGAVPPFDGFRSSGVNILALCGSALFPPFAGP